LSENECYYFLNVFSHFSDIVGLIFIHAVKFVRSFQFSAARNIPNVESITRKGASVLWETHGIFVMGVHATRCYLSSQGKRPSTARTDFSAKRLKYPRAGKCHCFFI